METFIVRVMPEDSELRGVVRRVADGSETTFADADELLALLRERRRVQHDNDVTGSPT